MQELWDLCQGKLQTQNGASPREVTCAASRVGRAELPKVIAVQMNSTRVPDFGYEAAQFHDYLAGLGLALSDLSLLLPVFHFWISYIKTT